MIGDISFLNNFLGEFDDLFFREVIYVQQEDKIIQNGIKVRTIFEVAYILEFKYKGVKQVISYTPDTTRQYLQFFLRINGGKLVLRKSQVMVP